MGITGSGAGRGREIRGPAPASVGMVGVVAVPPRAAARLAWALCIACLVCTVGGAALAVRNGAVDAELGWVVGVGGALLAFPVVGALVAARQPRNSVGWYLCLVGIFLTLLVWGEQYARYTLATSPGSLPGGLVVAWATSWAYVPVAAILVIFLPLSFPTGHLLSPRWRPVGWMGAAFITFAVVSGALLPGQAEVSGVGVVRNPFAVPAPAARTALGVVGLLALPCFGVGAMGAVAALVVRFRRSRGVERQQLKWFTYAAALTPLPFLAYAVSPRVSNALVAVLFPLVPVSVGVAILRHGLYDIDRLINRSVVYAGLTASVVAAYVLVVGGLAVVFEHRAGLAGSLLAAGVAAVLFQPLRERLQRGVNRLMYGDRDDPYLVISSLSRQLAAARPADELLADITESVAQAMRLPYVAIELERRGLFELAASYGDPTGEARAFPLTYHGETIGRLVAAPRASGEGLTAADRRLLEELARQAGAAAFALRLTDELQQSRERLVAAREEERRRLRRDLHDGLGPGLAGFALEIAAARNLLRRDPPAADRVLATLQADTRAAATEIRRLIAGLRPPALDELGLTGAIRLQAARLAGGSAVGPRDADNPTSVRVLVDIPDDLGRLPAAVEVAAYLIVVEALTNVVKHAQSMGCTVRVHVGVEGLELEVSDDGLGIPAGYNAGVGLASLRERAAELGGTCTIQPRATGGTCVRAELPLRKA
jgi:signal transduction histidine kinase